MKIVCPSCQAQYEVPETVLTSRRKMRCARCGTDWVPGDAAPQAAPGLEADIVPAAIEPEPPPTTHEPVAAPAPEPVPLADEPAAIAEPEMAWFEPEPPPLPLAELVPAPAEIPPPPPPPLPMAIRAERAAVPRANLPDPAAIVVPPRAPGPPVLAWVFSLALLVGLGASAVIYRAPIMKAWPPSTRVFAGLGLVGK